MSDKGLINGYLLQRVQLGNFLSHLRFLDAQAKHARRASMTKKIKIGEKQSSDVAFIVSPTTFGEADLFHQQVKESFNRFITVWCAKLPYVECQEND